MHAIWDGLSAAKRANLLARSKNRSYKEEGEFEDGDEDLDKLIIFSRNNNMEQQHWWICFSAVVAAACAVAAAGFDAVAVPCYYYD